MNIPQQLRESVLRAIPNTGSALMVFGSHARGDASDRSDIDVLEVRNRRARSYARGKISVSVYDWQTLQQMARSGSLFILHLKLEGQIVRDRQGKLQSTLDAYRPPESYDSYLLSLGDLFPLLDVSKADYQRNWKRFNELATFIARSFLYAVRAQAGMPVFSIKELLNETADEGIRAALLMKEDTRSVYSGFLKARERLGLALERDVTNPFGTLEAYITNASATNPLVLPFGLRLLGGEDMVQPYDLMATPTLL